MYFLVPYNLSDIQKGIQAGHAALEYANKYGHTHLYQKFIERHKTWIILNGGTTRTEMYDPGIMQIELQKIINYNKTYGDKIQYSLFYEPDVNNALTAICFICDERVWTTPDYEEFEDLTYDTWVTNEIGTLKNVVLRDIIKDKRLA
jgi:hypothetical protein